MKRNKRNIRPGHQKLHQIRRNESRRKIIRESRRPWHLEVCLFLAAKFQWCGEYIFISMNPIKMFKWIIFTYDWNTFFFWGRTLLECNQPWSPKDLITLPKNWKCESVVLKAQIGRKKRCTNFFPLVLLGKKSEMDSDASNLFKITC